MSPNEAVDDYLPSRGVEGRSTRMFHATTTQG